MTGFFRRLSPVVMHPGTLFADVGDIEKIGIDPFRREERSESGLVHPGGAGGNDDPIQRKFPDILFDEVLSRIRAEVAIIPGYLDPRQDAGKTDKFFAIHGCGDVRATMTNVNADFFIHQNKSQSPNSKLQIITNNPK